MAISVETYIVISLMFAVFAAVAAVGTSVVLGAGFERLRAGFEIVRRQSGFFADAIYKLDQKTQKLDEETSKLKGNVYNMGERIDRAEKQVTFMGDAIGSIEQRILQGTPSQPAKSQIRMSPVHTLTRTAPSSPKVQTGFVTPAPKQAMRQDSVSALDGLFRDYPEAAPMMSDMPMARQDNGQDNEIEGGLQSDASNGPSMGITTLLSRYFTGEQSGSGKGIIYH